MQLRGVYENPLKVFVETVQNCFDAHTAALFVNTGHDSLKLLAYSSLSDKIISEVFIKSGQGLLGWCFRNKKFIHATDFNRDTRTLGLYKTDVGIKSFMAAPIGSEKGVIMVDSKGQYAFSEKKQGQFKSFAKLSENLVDAFFHEQRLGYLNRFLENYFLLKGPSSRILEALLNITDLEIALMIRLRGHHIGVEYSFPQGILRTNEALYRDVRAFGAWLFKHKKPVVTDRFKALTRLEQLKGLGPTLIGLLTEPDADGINAWVLSGKKHLLGWPKGLEQVLCDVIKVFE